MTHPQTGPASSEAGFTLIEAMVAIVVLMVGIMAVANLMIVAATSNSVANQSTAAAASASEILDSLRVTPFANLAVGGDLDADVGAGGDCRLLGVTVGGLPADSYHCDSDIPGVGKILSRWRIAATDDAALRFIEVRSEATGAMGAGRSRAYFTTFRACVDALCP